MGRMNNISAFVIPGENGAAYRCANQMFSMLMQKPSELFVFNNSHVGKKDISKLNEIPYIGKVIIHPNHSKVEMIGIASFYASNERVMIVDGDVSIKPDSIQYLVESADKNPDAVICSTITELGDIEGFVGGATFSSEGKVEPNVFNVKQSGCMPIDCLQWGCILLPRAIANKACKGQRMATISQVSKRLTELQTEMLCCHDSVVSYKRMFNLKTEAA